MQIQCNPYQILFAEMEKFSLKFKMKMPEALNSQNYFFVCSLKRRTKLEGTSWFQNSPQIYSIQNNVVLTKADIWVMGENWEINLCTCGLLISHKVSMIIEWNKE